MRRSNKLEGSQRRNVTVAQRCPQSRRDTIGSRELREVQGPSRYRTASCRSELERVPRGSYRVTCLLHQPLDDIRTPQRIMIAVGCRTGSWPGYQQCLYTTTFDTAKCLLKLKQRSRSLRHRRNLFPKRQRNRFPKHRRSRSHRQTLKRSRFHKRILRRNSPKHRSNSHG
jgi:hypothetical protein